MPRQSAVSLFRRPLLRTLVTLEQYANGSQYRLRYSPTFLVGPPRCGGTVTRQLMAWGLRTCHFTNLLTQTVLECGSPLPVATAKMVRWLHGSPPADRRYRKAPFSNRFGQIPGRGAPAEGELIWGCWFGDRHGPVAPEELGDEQAREMYRAVAATEQVFGIPFVNKTTTLSLRIRAIVKVFPTACFIEVRRDPLDTAQSVYRARQTAYRHWLGPRPAECEDIDDEPLSEQVCRQVHYVQRNIDREREAVGAERFLTIDYREVCGDPSGTLARIADFMRLRGAPVDRIRTVPASFPYSHGQKVDDADYAQLRACLERLAGTRNSVTTRTS